MKILLTNDDGVYFPGILKLAEELRKSADVYIVAPEEECSATSQAITLYRSMEVVRHNETTFGVHGYPADCVSVGLYSGIIPEVDLVVSGINKGINMGWDVFYSGTVAAARQAAIHGYSGIALSHDCLYQEREVFSEIGGYFDELLKTGGLPLRPGAYYNINFPKAELFPYKGVRAAKLGRRIYKDAYSMEQLPGGNLSLALDGSMLGWDRTENDSDFYWFDQGYVTVTPLSLDQTKHDLLAELDALNDYVR